MAGARETRGPGVRTAGAPEPGGPRAGEQRRRREGRGAQAAAGGPGAARPGELQRRRQAQVRSHCSTPRHAERAGNAGAGGLKPGQPRGRRRGQRRGGRRQTGQTHRLGTPERATNEPRRPRTDPPRLPLRRDGGGKRAAEAAEREKRPRTGGKTRGEETRAEGGRRAGRAAAR